jgi:starch phosphorylase
VLPRLDELARNLWWTWHPEARAIFKWLDPALWRRTGHNPVRLLRDLPVTRLIEVADDGAFLRRYAAVLEAFDAEMDLAGGWCAARHPSCGRPSPISPSSTATDWPSLGRDRDRFLGPAITREPWGPGLNMTALGLHLAGHRNAVRRRHGEVTRRMWHGLWPDRPEDAVPIDAVTNGVHMPTWVSDAMDDLYRRYLGQDWVARHDDPEIWQRVADIPDRELWAARCALKHQVRRFLRDRARRRWAEDRADPSQVLASGVLLDPDALTLGCARRFTPYKRATLVLHDPKRLRTMLTDAHHPVQLVFAGKAHPADEAGKQLLEAVCRMARDPELAGRIAFIEDYDLEVARYLVEGVDAWLNTPRLPNEASGTSGQKAALNGVPSLSVLDGWWAEAYDGTNGWAIGEPGQGSPDPGARDAADAEALYRLLEQTVVPLYYDRDPDGVPRGWLRIVRRAIQTVTPAFSARRMLKDYVERFYVEAATVGSGSSGP